MLCEPEEDVDMTVVEDEEAEEEGGLLKLLLSRCCHPELLALQKLGAVGRHQAGRAASF